jgi:hypothetical protein
MPMRDARNSDGAPTEPQALVSRFFSGVTEYAFESELGVADPPLIDYISELLVRFLRSDDLFALRSVRGERLTKVSDMLAEASARRGPAKRQVHRHIGDFTLFWTGVYPEIADRMRRTGGADALLDYRELGKRNYLVAAQIPVAGQLPVNGHKAPADVLERLSDQFEICVAGLKEVRRIWEGHEGEGSGLIL